MDWDAERYHRLSNPQLGWGRRVLERLAPVAGERILDLGCGTGRLTAELAAAIGEGLVIAVDRSESMIRQASAQSYWHPGPHRLGSRAVHFVRADATRLPFVDVFDAVLSTATFHWISDHDMLFASIYRALVPGGRLVAQCGGGPNLKRLLDRAAALAATTFKRHFTDWRDPWEFADVPTTTLRLERAAFTSVDVYLEEAPTTLADRESFRDFLSCVCIREHLNRLPDEERPAFLDALADQAATDSPPFTLDYWRLNMIARKPSGIERAA